MKIIAHRGFWKCQTKKNSKIAFETAIENDFGIETDLRDLNGKIVISHDIPEVEKNLMTFEEFLKLYSSANKLLPLALNIKADGLQQEIKTLFEKYQIENYFFFDMSVPDAIVYHKNGFKNLFTRQSEYEQNPSFYNISQGVWMDEFYEEWISEKTIREHLNNQKQIAIVSPELHERENYQQRWLYYKSVFDSINTSNIFLCTDYPMEARKFFND